MSGENLSIEIKYMRRKTLALMVTHEGKVLIKAPNRTSERYIMDFVESKKSWISKKLAHASQSQTSLDTLNLQQIDIPKQKKTAKQLVFEK
jgi:predicted metal-dependent hydrolase